ncbi:MAG: hypothetical protein HC833_23320 [Leptolyngbyaceae cyanobacterium RM1_406_9]|nr:hypothetical protein [Leptolyngbyaceae cyanobacterium RM1_406_9]
MRNRKRELETVEICFVNGSIRSLNGSIRSLDRSIQYLYKSIRSPGGSAYCFAVAD